MNSRERVKKLIIDICEEPAPESVFNRAPFKNLTDRDLSNLEIVLRQAVYCAQKNQRFVNANILELLINRVSGKIPLPVTSKDPDYISPDQQAREAKRILAELDADERAEAEATSETEEAA